MELTIKRGDIYYAELNPVIGSGQGGTRPVLIISNDIGNKHSPTVIIAPITSRVHTKAKLPTHALIKDFDGLDKNSIILFEQILYTTAATPPSFLMYMSYRLYRITRRLILFCKPYADGKGFICAMNKTPVKSS